MGDLTMKMLHGNVSNKYRTLQNDKVRVCFYGRVSTQHEEHLEFIRRAYKVDDEAYTRQLLERLELWDKKDKLGKDKCICRQRDHRDAGKKASGFYEDDRRCFQRHV